MVNGQRWESHSIQGSIDRQITVQLGGRIQHVSPTNECTDSASGRSPRRNQTKCQSTDRMSVVRDARAASMPAAGRAYYSLRTGLAALVCVTVRS